jgi:flagellar biosynthesis/type III secretory pathway protein FliH
MTTQQTRATYEALKKAYLDRIRAEVWTEAYQEGHAAGYSKGYQDASDEADDNYNELGDNE